MGNSGKLGKISSGNEVLNISPFGLWVLASGKEYFLKHSDFPWFRGAAVEEVLNIEVPQAGHIRWPSLDIDLHVDSLENPERYPLIAKKSDRKKAASTRKVAR